MLNRVQRLRLFSCSSLAQRACGVRGLAISTAEVEDRLERAVNNVKETLTGVSLGDLGLVRSTRLRGAGPPSARRASAPAAAPRAEVVVNVPTGAYPATEALKRAVKEAAAGVVGGEADVRIALSDPGPVLSLPSLRRRTTYVKDGLSRVTHIVAVSSGKGGVGKSTIAVHLAYTLHAMGGRVGLFDADVFGPSLPYQVSPADDAVTVDSATGRMRPVRHEGLVLNSYGWTAPRGPTGERGGAAMRGPMVTTVVQQLARLTDWGSLDYLVVDMPPGTGDVVITLAQKVALSGTVLVTTPHELALQDARKGSELYTRMKVPPLALVNNMAFLRTGDNNSSGSGRGGGGGGGGSDGALLFPFGDNTEAVERLQSAQDIPLAVNLPIHDAFRIQPTFPYASPTITDMEGHQVQPIVQLAEGLVESLWRTQARVLKMNSAAGAGRSGSDTTLSTEESDEGDDVGVFVGPAELQVRRAPGGSALQVRALSSDSARQGEVSAAAARAASLAADAGDPATIAPDVRVVNVQAQGNYAVGVRFSDGHTAILPLEELARLAGVSET